MTWIVTANSNLCRIYHYDKNLENVSLLKELNHPESKLKKDDLIASDRPGRYQTDNSAGGGAFSPRTDPKDVEINNFSREIALELNHGRTTNAYTNLVIITPPHMTGLLTGHLDKHVKALIKKEIQKDVTQLAHREFLDFLKTNLKYE